MPRPLKLSILCGFTCAFAIQVIARLGGERLSPIGLTCVTWWSSWFVATCFNVQLSDGGAEAGR